HRRRRVPKKVHPRRRFSRGRSRGRVPVPRALIFISNKTHGSTIQPRTSNQSMKTQLTILASLCLTTAVLAAPETFDFKDAKGINNAGFKLDAPLESINGTANGVSGTVTFDPDKPGVTTGKIVVAANTLTLPNSMQQGHMRGPQWLDVAKYPEISF